MGDSKKLVWDEVGTREYEAGVSKVALYPMADNKYPKGVAWSGVTAVSETPEGAEANPYYADNIKYFNLIGAEDLGATLQAYSSPEEFDECDGTVEVVKGVVIGQQPRKMFGLSYVTILGNDTKGNKNGYKIHLLYGCNAGPSEKEYESVNEETEPMNLSWDISTTPVEVPGHEPTSRMIIYSTRCDPAKLKAFEDILWGNETTEARLPLPEEVIRLLTPDE